MAAGVSLKADSYTTVNSPILHDIGVYADTGQFIPYLPRQTDINGNIVPSTDYVTGTVDMNGYLNWLNTNGYGLTNLTAH